MPTVPNVAPPRDYSVRWRNESRLCRRRADAANEQAYALLAVMYRRRYAAMAGKPKDQGEE
jgi:hypothetical protein